MAGPSLAQLLGDSTTSNSELIKQTSLFKAFFKTWLKLDLTTLAAAVTLFGTITGLIRSFKSSCLKLYWWFTRFCTASISIASNDRLNKEIVNWIGAQVLERQDTRILTARTETIQTDAWLLRGRTVERNDFVFEKRIPIQYLPTFGMTWFIHERNVFIVTRMSQNSGHRGNGTPEEYASAPEGNEPLVIMCIGRSVAPIKRFLETCRDFAEQQRSAYVTVRVSKGHHYRECWDTTILRPMRPLETVHFDEDIKAEMVADIENYLDTKTRTFYTARGIPYRRGYLLHGIPGTGKTSLSLALAGHFGLELYLLHIPSIREDSELERHFTSLPPRCIVLLEDIDAVGIKNRPDDMNTDMDDEEAKEMLKMMRPARCTLSGLLNVLDGVASQEGRIVLMTSNHADQLDRALVRPGRIDKMIELGTINQRSAELMFYRMYAPDQSQATSDKSSLQEGELEKLALQFSTKIPENTFTPAQLQGLLLNTRNSPHLAVRETSAWVEAEMMKMAERKTQRMEMAGKIKERLKTKPKSAKPNTNTDLMGVSSEEIQDPETMSVILARQGNLLSAAESNHKLPSEAKEQKFNGEDREMEITKSSEPKDVCGSERDVPAVLSKGGEEEQTRVDLETAKPKTDESIIQESFQKELDKI